MLAHGTLGVYPAVFQLLRESMNWYEKAQAHASGGDEDALLRWNTCARVILRHRLRPPPGPPGSRA
jgi:hypothetical protein